MAHDGWSRTPDHVPGGDPEWPPATGRPGGQAPSAPGTPADSWAEWGHGSSTPGWGQPAPAAWVPPDAAPTGTFPATEPAPAQPRLAPWAVEPPQYAGPTGSSATPEGAPRRGGRARVLAAVVVVCLAVAAGGITWWVTRDDGSATTAAGATSAPPSAGTGSAAQTTSSAPATTRSTAPTTTAAPTPTVSPEDRALAELQALRARSLPRLVLDDRWVAQVASKSVGTTDPLQVAENGTHTFYAVDILAESRAVVASVTDRSTVLVLQSTDFGKRSLAPDGRPYWVTVVDAGFSSSDQVEAWCASTYPALSAEELANACAPRTLSTPHG